MQKISTQRHRYAPRDQPDLQAALDRIAVLERELHDPGVDLAKVDPDVLDASLRRLGRNEHGDVAELVIALQQVIAELPLDEYGECECCNAVVPLGVEACWFCGSPDGAAAASDSPSDAAPDEGDALGVDALADAIRAAQRAGLVDDVAAAQAIRALLASVSLPRDSDAWLESEQEHETMGHTTRGRT